MTLKSQKPTYVIGHLNPDTDAICAAIGYAEFMNQVGEEEAVALRCGSIPSRVKWVLEQANVEAPALVEDVRTTAELISDKSPVTVSEDDTFLSVYNAMQASGMESLPVVSNEGDVKGILDFTQLMQLLMPRESTHGAAVKNVTVSPAKVMESLRGASVGFEISDKEEELVMFVGASSEKNTLKGVRAEGNTGKINNQLVICGDRTALQKAAIDRGVRLMIVTGGHDVDLTLCELAKQNGVMIISCKYDTATTVQLVRCSRVVKSALGSEFLCVDAGEAVSDMRKRLSIAQQELFPVVKAGTTKLIGVFTKADLVDPPETKLVLVDHNEYSQAVRGAEEAFVKEVIDHHRLGGDIVSREPIRFMNEPVGSSSTLVARQFKYLDVPLSKGVAMCLCAGLISDTLNLTSPTTTETDRVILKWLCGIAQVDPDTFTRDFFASGSLLHKGTVDELINTDRKEFCEGGKSITISQIEEIGLEKFADRKREIQDGLADLLHHRGYDLGLVAVTDITKHVSLIVACGEERIIEALPFNRGEDGVITAEGVVSRKKQIFPAVCKAIHTSSATVIEEV